MSEGTTSTKIIPIVVIAWILSLVTTLAIVYVAPNIFPISVSTDNIADSAVITTKLGDGTVTSAKILDGTLTAEDISDGSIIAVKVANGAVTTTKIEDGAISTDKLANEAVTTDKLANSSIVAIKLADGSITSAKILDGSVTAVDLANGSIVTAKIEDGAVTTEKIADGAVTMTKLAAGAIPYNATSSTFPAITNQTSFGPMPDMSVNITLSRKSTLIIMFSAMAGAGSGGSNQLIYIRAMVNSTPANPVSDWIQFAASGPDYAICNAFNFHGNFSAGTHKVSIQWRALKATPSVVVYRRSLIVFALPT